MITRLHESRDFLRTCFAFKKMKILCMKISLSRSSRWMERIIILLDQDSLCSSANRIRQKLILNIFRKKRFVLYLQRDEMELYFSRCYWDFHNVKAGWWPTAPRYVKGEDVRRGFMNKKKETGTNAMHRRFVDRATIFIMGCRVICKHKITSRIACTRPYCSRWLVSISFEHLLGVENLSKWNI